MDALADLLNGAEFRGEALGAAAILLAARLVFFVILVLILVVLVIGRNVSVTAALETENVKRRSG